MLNLLYAVGEAVEAGDAEGGEAVVGAVGVGLAVEGGDEGDADGDMLGADEGEQEFKVVPRQFGVTAGVGAVDVGVAFFYVDDKIAHYRAGAAYALGAHLQRGLGGEVPALAAQGAERLDEVDAQQRFSAAEADAAAGGDEVEVVDAYVVVELLWRISWQVIWSLKTAVVEAIFAPQRTAVEGRQRGHPHAVHPQPVPVDAYERYCFHFGVQRYELFANREKSRTFAAGKDKIMTKDNDGINHTTNDEHQGLVNAMACFMDNGKPKVGIFWYDMVNGSLFGVEKIDAEQAVFVNGKATIGKLHKTYWQKQHHRAESKGDTSSIFYSEHNYTMIPRGRIFLDEATDRFYVCVGHWLNDIDQEHFREVLEDEFNLPEDFELVIDHHWDLGHGWSEEIF